MGSLPKKKRRTFVRRSLPIDAQIVADQEQAPEAEHGKDHS
jgi:hypothetical protein